MVEFLFSLFFLVSQGLSFLVTFSTAFEATFSLPGSLFSPQEEFQSRRSLPPKTFFRVESLYRDGQKDFALSLLEQKPRRGGNPSPSPGRLVRTSCAEERSLRIDKARFLGAKKTMGKVRRVVSFFLTPPTPSINFNSTFLF